MLASNCDDSNSQDVEKGNRRNQDDCIALRDQVGPRCCSIIVALGFILAIILLPLSIKKVQSNEYAGLYNVHAKSLDETPRTSGLHTGSPGFSLIRFPSTFVTQDLQETCLSRDGLRVAYELTFQYQMPESWMLPTILKYRNYDKWTDIVAGAGSSAVQHACSEFGISDFQNQRGAIQLAMEGALRIKLEGESGTGKDGVYAKAISLQLSNLELPSLYEDAISMKQSAKEDIELAVNERGQQITKAETELLAAREEARKIHDRAVNDANVTTTQANLNAEETLFAFEQEAATIVRLKQSLNLTTEGVLGFLANNMLAQVSNLHVSAQEPAQFSQKEDEL